MLGLIINPEGNYNILQKRNIGQFIALCMQIVCTLKDQPIAPYDERIAV